MRQSPNTVLPSTSDFSQPNAGDYEQFVHYILACDYAHDILACIVKAVAMQGIGLLFGVGEQDGHVCLCDVLLPICIYNHASVCKGIIIIMATYMTVARFH